MQRFYVEDLSNVAEAMFDEITNEGNKEVMFVGFYEDAIEIIKELMMYDSIVPHSLEIHPEEWDWYDKEYYVTLDKNLELWVEPAILNDKYLTGDTDVLFMTGDCNSAILTALEPELAVEIVFEDNCDCCEDCRGECCCHGDCDDMSNNHSVATQVAVDDEGHIHGFEKTWTTYENGMYYVSTYQHYSNNEESLKKLMKDFDVKIK